MEQKVCKKCKKVLPENYKYSKCEACRNKGAQTVKKIGAAAGAVLSVAIPTLIGLVSNGKIKMKK